MSRPDSQTTISNDDARFVEGYAAALWHLALAFNWVDDGCKSYDPMTIESETMHSYVFDMKDGGRHHPIAEYKNREEICNVLLEDAITWVPLPRK